MANDNTSRKVKNLKVGVQVGTTDTLYAEWDFTDKNNHLDTYKYKWEYTLRDDDTKKWWPHEPSDGGWSDTNSKIITCSVPDNDRLAKVRFTVKPVAKTYKKKKKNSKGKTVETDQTYWDPTPSSDVITAAKIKGLVDLDEVGEPTVTYDNTTHNITAVLDIDDNKATHVEFKLVYYEAGTNDVNRSSKREYTGTQFAEIVNRRASYTFVNVEDGYDYRLKCRSVDKKGAERHSEWSAYVDVAVAPLAPNYMDVSSKKSEQPGSEPQAIVSWSRKNNSSDQLWAGSRPDSFEIQFTTDRDYFDHYEDRVTTITADGTINSCYASGIEAGYEYFFRIRSKKGDYYSEWFLWSGSIKIGTAPSPPSIWTLVQSGVMNLENGAAGGEDINFYWVHNPTDNSHASEVQFDFTFKDSHGNTIAGDVITRERYWNCIIRKNPNPDNPDNYGNFIYDAWENDHLILRMRVSVGSKDTIDKIRYLIVNTNISPMECEITWTVSTRGCGVDYSEPSSPRLFKIFIPPTAVLNVGIKPDETWAWDPFSFIDGNIETAEKIEGNWATNLPYPIAVEVFPNLNAWQYPVAYYLTISAQSEYEIEDEFGNITMIVAGTKILTKTIDSNESSVTFYIEPSDVRLENGITYDVEVTVLMSSSLMAYAKDEFTVSWSDYMYNPEASIVVDSDDLIAYISPLCLDEDEHLVGNVGLSVYRRNYDGSFTLIAEDVDNAYGGTITDPHPCLNLARYRIVAKNRQNGSLGFADVPGEPVFEPSIVIQWNERWSEYDVTASEIDYLPQYGGSLLKLPYNVDVTERIKTDSELVSYIGREHPVSYYGTQREEGMTLSTKIPKDDVDTLYALRRLSAYKGDVYVREPSGIGYWGTISIDKNINHKELTIPITIEVTRVEGGI